MTCVDKGKKCISKNKKITGVSSLNGTSASTAPIESEAVPFMSFDDYAAAVLTPPKSDPDYGFYKAWGLNEYLKKTRKQSLEQAKYFLRSGYESAKFLNYLESRGVDLELKDSEYEEAVEKALVGTPYMRSKQAASLFMGGYIAKGDYVFKLWDNGDGTGQYWAPTGRSAFGNFLGSFPNADFEDTDEVFTTSGDLRQKKADNLYFAKGFEMEGGFVQIPGLDGTFWVERAKMESNDLKGVITVVPASPKKNGSGWKKTPKTKKETLYIDREVFENIQRQSDSSTTMNKE